MLETKPPTECWQKHSCCCTDQKQAKNKNFYIIFLGGDVTIYMYPLPPMSHFVTNFGYTLTPSPGDVIFELPLMVLISFNYVAILSFSELIQVRKEIFNYEWLYHDRLPYLYESVLSLSKTYVIFSYLFWHNSMQHDPRIKEVLGTMLIIVAAPIFMIIGASNKKVYLI